jgi:hypothetical protein
MASQCADNTRRQFVTLRNGTGTLAVYLVRADWTLERLEKWPSICDDPDFLEGERLRPYVVLTLADCTV